MEKIDPREHIDYLQRKLQEAHEKEQQNLKDRNRYYALRLQELVIMSPEGARYLKGIELDEYVDALIEKMLFRSEGIVAQEVRDVFPQAVVVQP
jgi:hypothetical protein